MITFVVLATEQTISLQLLRLDSDATRLEGVGEPIKMEVGQARDVAHALLRMCERVEAEAQKPILRLVSPAVDAEPIRAAHASLESVERRECVQGPLPELQDRAAAGVPRPEDASNPARRRGPVHQL